MSFEYVMIILFIVRCCTKSIQKEKDLAIIPFKSPMCFFLHYTSMGTQYEVMPLLCSEPIIIPLKIIEHTNKTSFIHCNGIHYVLNYQYFVTSLLSKRNFGTQGINKAPLALCVKNAKRMHA